MMHPVAQIWVRIGRLRVCERLDANLLRLIRDPLMGHVPTLSTYVMGIALILMGFTVTLPLFVRYRARIVYWL